MKDAKWIWLDENRYPQHQHARYTVFCDPGDTAYAVVEFQKEIFLRGAVSSAQVEIFADTKFWLYQDEAYIGTGPVHPGGDYGFTQPMEKQYSCVYGLRPQGAVKGPSKFFANWLTVTR